MGQSKAKMNIIVCGLDNSGKTTIINQMKPEDHRSENISATVGYSVDTFTKGKVKFTAFDMGGAKKFRSLWESYYATVEGVIFVVDSTDALRMCVVKDELLQMLQHPVIQARKIPFLFFANKVDLQQAKNPAELAQILELGDALGGHPFNIFASDALRGVGIEDGIVWLRNTMLQLSGKK